jgi:hypothetical protein
MVAAADGRARVGENDRMDTFPLGTVTYANLARRISGKTLFCVCISESGPLVDSLAFFILILKTGPLV